jgi:hypothetical protein
VPVWDLVAALWVLEPLLLETDLGVARLLRSGLIVHGTGTRPLRVVRGFEPDALWRRFLGLLRDARGAATAARVY